jgi:NitT/TauT family transport system permease protein
MFKKILPPLLSLLLLLALTEIAARLQWVNPSLIPAPSQCWSGFVNSRGELLAAFFESFKNILLGWGLSLVIGTLIAFLFSLFQFLKNAILPFAIFFQTVPIIAIAPLLVIYFGFGAPTVIVSSCIVAIFPVIASTLIGLESIPAPQVELFQFYHASRWKTLLKLKIPAAYIAMYNGFKISAGLAVIGAVAGEFVSGGGLGAMIDAARTQQRIDLVFVCLLLLSLIGLMLIGFIRAAHGILNRFRPVGLSLKD